jgi:hypothetical protein
MNALPNQTMGNLRLAPDYFTSSDPRANTELAARVTGHFTGTTDEILQWGACKWGIDENVVRAMAVQESAWRQTARGDWVSDRKFCAPGHGLGADGRRGLCPKSWGILQVSYRFYPSAWPAVVTSTAFNVDAVLATVRACYEGYEWWLGDEDSEPGYTAGDLWGCVGRWYSGHWRTPGAYMYIRLVQARLAAGTWQMAGFQEP